MASAAFIAPVYSVYNTRELSLGSVCVRMPLCVYTRAVVSQQATVCTRPWRSFVFLARCSLHLCARRRWRGRTMSGRPQRARRRGGKQYARRSYGGRKEAGARVVHESVPFEGSRVEISFKDQGNDPRFELSAEMARLRPASSSRKRSPRERATDCFRGSRREFSARVPPSTSSTRAA